ncbi:hypothetical protein HNR34_002902 [Geobacillus subterraneus]
MAENTIVQMEITSSQTSKNHMPPFSFFVSAQLSLIQMHLHCHNRLVNQEDAVDKATYLSGKLLSSSSERA